MLQFLTTAFVTIAAAAAVTAVLGIGFAQLVKREESFKKKVDTQIHSHDRDDANTRHPTPV